MLVLECCVFMKHTFHESMLVKYSLDPIWKMDWHSPKMNVVRSVRKPCKWLQEVKCKRMQPKKIYSHSRTCCMYFEIMFYIIIVTVIHTFAVLLLCQFNKLNISFSILFCIACLYNINIYANWVRESLILTCCQALIYKYLV